MPSLMCHIKFSVVLTLDSEYTKEQPCTAHSVLSLLEGVVWGMHRIKLQQHNSIRHTGPPKPAGYHSVLGKFAQQAQAAGTSLQQQAQAAYNNSFQTQQANPVGVPCFACLRYQFSPYHSSNPHHTHMFRVGQSTGSLSTLRSSLRDR